MGVPPKKISIFSPEIFCQCIDRKSQKVSATYVKPLGRDRRWKKVRVKLTPPPSCVIGLKQGKLFDNLGCCYPILPIHFVDRQALLNRCLYEFPSFNFSWISNAITHKAMGEICLLAFLHTCLLAYLLNCLLAYLLTYLFICLLTYYMLALKLECLLACCFCFLPFLASVHNTVWKLSKQINDWIILQLGNMAHQEK